MSSDPHSMSVLVVVLAGSFVAALAFALGLWRALSRLLPRYRARFRERVDLQLGRAHLFIDASRLLLLNLATALAASVAVGWLAHSALVALLCALCTGLAPRITLAWVSRRRLSRLRGQLPDVMLLTAAALRAGAGLSAALAQVAAEVEVPARQELEMMLREQRLGASFAEALSGLERRIAIDDVTLFVAALRISHLTGGDLADTLERLASSMRVKLALEGKVRALTAQGKLQGWVMGLLPAGLALLLMRIEPQAMSALFETRAGLAVVAFVVVMQAIGVWFIRRIVAVEV